MKKMKKVLAVASAGGHWIELLRLKPAFEGTHLTYVSTNSEVQKDVEEKLMVVTDANIWEKLKLIRMFWDVLWVVISIRPDVIISTGAAPGFAAIFFGKLFGAKTIWVDSIANAEELSGSGLKVKKFTDIWLTQWEHLATDKGPDYKGRVL